MQPGELHARKDRGIFLQEPMIFFEELNGFSNGRQQH